MPERTHLFAQLDAHTESNFFTGFSGDLSDGGLFVTTYEPLEVGQAVHVELSMPGGRFVEVRGTVAWQRVPFHGQLDLAPGVGIALDGMDAETEQLVKVFMHLREPSFVDPDVLSRGSRMRGNAVSGLPPAIEDPEPPPVVPAAAPTPVEAAPEPQAHEEARPAEAEATTSADSESAARTAGAETEPEGQPEAVATEVARAEENSQGSEAPSDCHAATSGSAEAAQAAATSEAPSAQADARQSKAPKRGGRKKRGKKNRGRKKRG